MSAPDTRQPGVPDAMAERDRQIRSIAEDFGWEAWVGLKNGLWHARLPGATPPRMIHDNSADGLRAQLAGLPG